MLQFGEREKGKNMVLIDQAGSSIFIDKSGVRRRPMATWREGLSETDRIPPRPHPAA